MVPTNGMENEKPAALSAVDGKRVRSISSKLSEFDAVVKNNSSYSDYLEKSKRETYGMVKDIGYPALPENVESTEDFFQFQRDTSQTIHKIIDIAIDNYLENMAYSRGMPAVSPRWEQLFHIQNKSRGNVGVRGVHSRIYNLALGGDDDANAARIGASMELLMAHMYYVNQILDGKGGADPRVNIFGAKSNLELSKLLLTRPTYGPERTVPISESIVSDQKEILNKAYEGAHIDTNFLNWNNLKSSTFEERIGVYNYRSYLMQTLFFVKMTDIIAKSIYMHSGREVPDSSVSRLKEYAYNFGMGTQLVNDIADFVPPEQNSGTRTKLPTDSYSDFRHRTLTMPVIHTLEMAENSDREKFIGYLEKEKMDDGDLLDSTKIFLKSGAYKECRALARVYKDRAAKAAKSFPEPAHKMMSYSTVILDSNRYYRALGELSQNLHIV